MALDVHKSPWAPHPQRWRKTETSGELGWRGGLAAQAVLGLPLWLSGQALSVPLQHPQCCGSWLGACGDKVVLLRQCSSAAESGPLVHCQ